MPASLRIAAAVAYCTFLVASDAAGQTFDLSVPGTTTRSVAVLSVDRLRITGDDGTTFTYLREPRYDVAGYLGFYDDVSRQAVRWPTGGADRFEIGSVGLRGITFRTSQMVIVPRAAPLPPTPRPPLPGPPTPRRAPAPASGEVELTVANRTGAGLAIYYVDRSTGRRTKYFDIASSASERQPSYVGHVWQAVDARGSVVEEYRVPDFATVTWEIGGAAPALFDPAAIYTLESALGRDALLSARPLNGANAEVGGAADTRSVRLKLRPTDSGYFEIASADSPDLVLDLPGAAETEGTNVRLWDRRDGSAAAKQFRLVSAGGDWYHLESRLRRDYVIGIDKSDPRAGTNIHMFARPAANTMFRLLEVGAAPAAGVFVSRTTEANPPLAPARVELANTHTKELWVLVADLRDPTASLKVKIPAGGSQVVSLDRDPGARIVEIYELARADGSRYREEVVTEIPPAVFYDVSVYELIVQSVAIDRTVPGGRITEVNHSPKSLGFFVVPPGDQLVSGKSDVYAIAKSQENPGGVRRIDPAQWENAGSGEDPFESRIRREFGELP